VDVAGWREGDVAGVMERRPGADDGAVVVARRAGVRWLPARAERQEKPAVRGELADRVVGVVGEVNRVVRADADAVRADAPPLPTGGARGRAGSEAPGGVRPGVERGGAGPRPHPPRGRPPPRPPGGELRPAVVRLIAECTAVVRE